MKPSFAGKTYLAVLMHASSIYTVLIHFNRQLLHRLSAYSTNSATIDSYQSYHGQFYNS